MQIFSAKAQRQNKALAFSFAPLRLCGKNLLSVARARKAASHFIAIAISLSFFAMLVPISSASNKAAAMACCVGKDAAHCDSGIPAKKVPPPKSEPMCGLDNAEMEDDGITIVAKPVQTDSHHSLSQTADTDTSQTVAESNSLSQPCNMDCVACAAGATRQQKRERSFIPPTAFEDSSLPLIARGEDQTLLFSTGDYWEQINPRGPPHELR